MLWFPLLVLTAFVLFFKWVTNTVCLGIWAIRSRFGEGPSRLELWSFQAIKGATGFVAGLWWFFLFARVFA